MAWTVSTKPMSKYFILVRFVLRKDLFNFHIKTYSCIPLITIANILTTSPYGNCFKMLSQSFSSITKTHIASIWTGMFTQRHIKVKSVFVYILQSAFRISNQFERNVLIRNNLQTAGIEPLCGSKATIDYFINWLVAVYDNENIQICIEFVYNNSGNKSESKLNVWSR